VQEWLSMLCLDIYLNNLLREGFNSVEQMIGITWEDLEDIGINKLGINCPFAHCLSRVKLFTVDLQS